MKLICAFFLFFACNLTAKVNFAFFDTYHDGNRSQVDLYFNFYNDIITYDFISGDTLFTELAFEVSIFSSIGTEREDSWIYRHYLHKSDREIKLLLERRTYMLLPGMYRYKIRARDKFRNIILEKEGNLEVASFDKRKKAISGPIVAFLAEGASTSALSDSLMTEDLLNRRGLTLFPNVTDEVYGNNVALSLVFDFINFGNEEKLLMIIEASGNKQRMLREEFPFSVKGRNTSHIFEVFFDSAETMPLALNFKFVSDHNPNDTIYRSKKIFFINPLSSARAPAFVQSEAFEQSIFSAMDEERITDEFLKAKPILMKREIEEFEMLTTLRAKQRAMFMFWKLRDPDTTTVLNERLRDFNILVEYADRQFIFGPRTKGWKTERGRVLRQYGMPTSRQIYPQREGRNAAEEWIYDSIQGGAFFYFVDRLGNGDFTLAHSSAVNEIKNFNWFELYKPAIEDDGSGRYRQRR